MYNVKYNNKRSLVYIRESILKINGFCSIYGAVFLRLPVLVATFLLQNKLYAHALQTYLTLWPSKLRNTASHLWHLPLLWKVKVENQQKTLLSWSPQKENGLGYP